MYNDGIGSSYAHRRMENDLSKRSNLKCYFIQHILFDSEWNWDWVDYGIHGHWRRFPDSALDDFRFRHEHARSNLCFHDSHCIEYTPFIRSWSSFRKINSIPSICNPWIVFHSWKLWRNFHCAIHSTTKVKTTIWNDDSVSCLVYFHQWTIKKAPTI